MKRITICLCLLATNLAQAAEDEQRFTVANNGTVIATASQKEITRIVFSSDVELVHSIAGELEYNVWDKDVYLRTSADKPVNFFVRTVQGQTYKFILDVLDIPATQIFVESIRNALKKNQAINHPKPVYKNDTISEGLQQRIAKIIDVTLKPKKHLGYTINKTEKNFDPVNGILLKQVGIISGKMLIAKKFIITTDDLQTLNLRDFIEEGVLAVYADKDHLNPGEKGILIKISEE